MSLTVKTSDGSVVVAAVTTIELDQSVGYILTQGDPNEAEVSLGITTPDASLTQRGLVNLTAQSLGAGAKYFSDKVGIGTAAPLANAALDVRGYNFVYFAGGIYFGGGNVPASESSACQIIYSGSGAGFSISFMAPPADWASGHAIGTIMEGTQADFLLRHKTAGDPAFGYLNDDTHVTSRGQTVSTNGLSFQGGLLMSGQVVPAPTGGPGGHTPPRQTAAVNAAGNSQATGVVLTADVNTVNNVTAMNNAAVLPIVTDGSSVTVINPTAGLALNLFPPSGGSIRGAAANTSLAVAGGSSVTLTCSDPTNKAWW